MSISRENLVKIGIQWGEGSFNHIAIRDFLARNPDFEKGKAIEIVFLFTTEAVLDALGKWLVDYGQFALANSTGGIVQETIAKIGKYRWEYVDDYRIAVRHSLLMYPDITASDITAIMWHEQALKQVKNTLAEHFPDIPKIPGTGELIDNAAIAQAISNWDLPQTTVSVGHESLADIYGLEVLERDIQDRDDNETTFILVTL